MATPVNSRKSVLPTPGAPPPFRSYYSNAVRVSAGDLLFVSGQVAWDDEGNVVCPGDGPGQAAKAFDNVAAVLAAHGATFDDVVRIIVYVTDLDWFDELSSLRERLFRDNGPSSTIVQVTGLVQPELMVEVEVVAAVG